MDDASKGSAGSSVGRPRRAAGPRGRPSATGRPSARPPSGGLRASLACAVLAAALGSTDARSPAPARADARAAHAGARSAAAPAVRQLTADADFALDDFEADGWPDPALWPAVDGWRPSTCQAHTGRRSLRAFAPRDGQPDRACDAAVPAGAAATAALRLDLRSAGAANRLELQFEAWIRLNAGDDAGLVIWLEAPQPDGAMRRVPIFGATGDAGGWAYPTRHLDLRNLVDVRNPAVVYDLRGGVWTLAWTAAAPAGSPAGGGVFIDRLRLVWEPDASFPTPTPPPSPTPSPTRPTATPRRTATPTEEPTPTDAPPPPTRTRAAGVAYLPVLNRDPSPTPTPTSAPTATPTATTPSSPPPADTPPHAGTASPTATASPTDGATPPAGAGAAPAGRPGRVLSSPSQAPVAQRIERLASNQ